MFRLRCPVRSCSLSLELRNGGLTCPSGHHFDRAKEGYWSLLQPQDRKSKNAGDMDAAVLARQRWLARGHAGGLVEALRPWIARTASSSSTQTDRTIDLGCGEGSFGPALFSSQPQDYCGVDLAKRAIKLAARGWPAATWVLANADRTLPVEDGSVQRVLSLFGRRPILEIARILVQGGYYLVAVPGEEDLIELREQVQASGGRRKRWEIIAEETSKVGMKLLEHRLWKEQIRLEPEAIADALAMTYRAVRYSQQERAAELRSMPVTLAADLLLFQQAS